MATPPVKVPIMVIDKFTAPIRLFTQRVNAMTKPIDDVTKHMSRLHKSTNQAFDALMKPVRFAAKPFTAAFSAITGGLSSMAGIVGIASIGAAAAGIVKITKDTAEFAQELSNTAFRLGLTVKGVQMLQYAAKMSDVPIENFNMSMTKLTKYVGGALTGNTKNRSLLSALGIDVSKTKDTQAIFLKLADTLGKIKNTNLRNTVLLELFGKGGTSMALMLRNGSAGIREYMEARKKMGLLDEDSIKKAEEFDQSWKKLQATFEGIRNTVGNAFMPGMINGIQKLSELLLANKDKIKSFFEGIASKLTVERLEKIGSNIESIAKSAEVFAGALGQVAKFIGLINSVTVTPLAKVFDVFANPSAGEPPSSSPKSPSRVASWLHGDATTAISRTSQSKTITEKNQALLQIQVSSDGSTKTNMIGSLGHNIGWSMVTP